ncbi:MATH domain-containing protein [Chloropicon primus]|uniref:MATH domain-containing protein n=1 Tax=Chloropicon primus TaxID=1764295 RepID=A0A5B8MKZ3_9CHLO|nr:hypothetical protein A3770_05p36550 [Chloropicon primus]UPR00351.1 MATH domain-containing protein [Chloropicon primus]|eukprot:QDZ21137.1 hypothetical protein A3770_05p36550 [Chloropicon primus]
MAKAITTVMDEKRGQLEKESPHASLIISYKDKKMHLDAMYMSRMSGLVHDFIFEGTQDVLGFVDLSDLKPDEGEAADAEDKGKGSRGVAHMAFPEGLFTAGGWNALVEVVSLLYSAMFFDAGDLVGLFDRYPLQFSMPEDSLEGETHTWSIKNWSSENGKKEIKSEPFTLAGCKWYLSLFPEVSRSVSSHMSLYLCLADAGALPSWWSRKVSYELAVVNPENPDMTRTTKAGPDCFNRDLYRWGYHEILSLADLGDPNKGFVVDDVLQIRVTITEARRSTTGSLEDCTCDSLLDAARFLRADMVTTLLDKAVVTYLKDCVPGLFSDHGGHLDASQVQNECTRKCSQKVMASLALADEYGLCKTWTYFLDQATKWRTRQPPKTFVRDLVSFFKAHEKTMNSDAATGIIAAMIQ